MAEARGSHRPLPSYLLNQLTHPWFVELWERARTPALALKLRLSTLAKLAD